MTRRAPAPQRAPEAEPTISRSPSAFTRLTVRGYGDNGAHQPLTEREKQDRDAREGRILLSGRSDSAAQCRVGRPPVAPEIRRVRTQRSIGTPRFIEHLDRQLDTPIADVDAWTRDHRATVAFGVAAEVATEIHCLLVIRHEPSLTGRDAANWIHKCRSGRRGAARVGDRTDLLGS